MPLSRPSLAAVLVLFAASPALAQEAPAEPQATPPADCAPAKGKAPGVGALLSAARRAGVGQLLANQSLAGGKGGVASAVLGAAISATDSGAPRSSGVLPFGFGDGKAAAAAAATGTAIEVAKAAATPKPATCPNP